MIRAVLIAAVCAATAAAQFRDLATTADGRRLYFSSASRLKGTSQAADPKLFCLDSAGLRLYAQRERGQPIGWTVTNFYALAAPEVSADGSVLAYTATRHCGGGSGCLSVERSQANIERAGRPALTFAGKVRLSRNGKWAVMYGFSTILAPAVTLLDTETGEQTTFSQRWGAFTRQSVADDGTLVGMGMVWRKSGLTRLLATANPETMLIDRAASRVVYESLGPRRLAVVDLKTDKEIALATAGVPMQPMISDDGATVLFRAEVGAAPQLFLIATDGSGRQQLTSDAGGIAEGVLSGNGRVVYAVTGNGRLLRIDAATSGAEELIPRTPQITDIQPGTAVPGSLLRIAGTGLADAGAAGVQVKLGGLALPLLHVSSEMIWAQAPWDSPPGQAAFQLVSGDSPFEDGPETLPVARTAPWFYGFPEIVAVHENWEALVSEANPAVEGEVVHTYMSGLGPVIPPVSTGAPTPLAPLSLAAPLACRFWDGGPNDTEVLFAGLAPGMVGVYQVSLRVPRGIRMNRPSVECGYGSEPPAFGSLPVRNSAAPATLPVPAVLPTRAP